MHKNEYYKKDNKILGKLVIITVIINLIIISVALISYGNEEQDYITIEVNDGESIWNIARKYRQENLDIRRMVYMIKKANKIDDSILQPGQKLKIPVLN